MFQERNDIFSSVCWRARDVLWGCGTAGLFDFRPEVACCRSSLYENWLARDNAQKMPPRREHRVARHFDGRILAMQGIVARMTRFWCTPGLSEQAMHVVLMGVS